jgi:tetratricopeptide (TPR) repeat protein
MVESTTPIDVTLGGPMRWAWSWLAASIAAVVLAAPLARAAAGPANNDAQSLYAQATAAFGLGRYGEAGEKYEAAFALRPDPALLYNAAQSFRLAHNSTRALELYRNYVRLYPGGANVEEARSHAATLNKVVEMAPPPAAGGPPPPPIPVAPPPAPPPPRPGTTNGPLVSKPAASGDEKKPITQRTWFWVAVGAAAVLVGTTVLLTASGGESYPDATFGTARGN